MRYENIAFFLTFSLCISEAFSLENSSNVVWSRFNGKHIFLNLPAGKYSNIIEYPHDGQSDYFSELGIKNKSIRINFSLTKRRPLGGSSADVGSICNGPIIVCAVSADTQNYWIDQSTQSIRLGDPTSPVYRRRLGAWQAYEAFPLCGWTSAHGVYIPYGGQCYTAVLTNDNKTVNFQILLGKNSGCKEIETCWAYSLDSIRKMMASIDR